MTGAALNSAARQHWRKKTRSRRANRRSRHISNAATCFAAASIPSFAREYGCHAYDEFLYIADMRPLSNRTSRVFWMALAAIVIGHALPLLAQEASAAATIKT